MAMVLAHSVHIYAYVLNGIKILLKNLYNFTSFIIMESYIYLK